MAAFVRCARKQAILRGWYFLSLLPPLMLAWGSADALEYRMRSPNPTWMEPYTGYVDVVSGNFDSDHRLDMAICFGGEKVKIFSQNSQAQQVLRHEEMLWDQRPLPPENPYALPIQDCRIHVVDIDGNGTDDLLLTNSLGALVLRPMPDGTVHRQQYARRGGVFSFAGDGFLDSLAIDLDVDGDMDLLGVRKTGELSMMANQGGQLRPAVEVGFIARSNMAQVRLASGDLDSDGSPDVVAAFPNFGLSNEAGAAVLLHNDGRGRLYERTKLVHFANTNLQTPAIGDVTGDGKDDLVQLNSRNQPRAMFLVHEQGDDGLLKAPVAYPTYDIPEFIKIEDLDGDGRNDILLMHSTWNAIMSFLQTGDGQLDFHDLVLGVYNIQRNGGTQSVAALGDFQGDGCKDVLLATMHYSWADGTGCLPASNADVAVSVEVSEHSVSLRVSNLDPANAAFAVVAILKLQGSELAAFSNTVPAGCTGSVANVTGRAYVCRIGRLEPGEIRTYTAHHIDKKSRHGHFIVRAEATVSSHGADSAKANNLARRDFWSFRRRPVSQPQPQQGRATTSRGPVSTGASSPARPTLPRSATRPGSASR